MDPISWIYARKKEEEKQFSFILLYLARNGPALLEIVPGP